MKRAGSCAVAAFALSCGMVCAAAHNGKPIAGVQISAFSNADPQTRHLVRTDAEGRARVALPSAGPWLLNAAHMVDSTTANLHWLSWWASLTFARP
jgi:Domain of unknown function (DUF4198)